MKTGIGTYICKNCGMVFTIPSGKYEEKCIYCGHMCKNCCPESFNDE